MELVDRIGGFGKIRVSQQEDAQIKELFELAHTIFHKGTGAGRKERHEAIMTALFPAFSPKNHSIFRENKRHYHLINGTGELIIASTLPFQRQGNQNLCDLRIITHQHQEPQEYLMAICMDSTYQPDCTDDLVRIMGQGYQPRVAGPQPIPYCAEMNMGSRFAFAEIPYLFKIFELYQITDQLLASAPERISLTKEQLEATRKNSLNSADPLHQKNSTAFYRENLAALLLK